MKTIRALTTQYAGRLFRSRAEARWAVFFDEMGLQWDHEPEGYDLGAGDWYLPDFWVHGINFWFEVKGQEPSDAEVRRCRALVMGTGKPALIAIGPPRLAEQLVAIFPDPDENEMWARARFVFAEDRRTAGEYWLLTENGCMSIGPVAGPDHGRYPLIHNTVERAYEKAMSARFDGAEHRS
jgi:hypothetical protein